MSKFEKFYFAVLLIFAVILLVLTLNYKSDGAVPPNPNPFCLGGNVTFAWEYNPMYVRTYTSVECLNNNGFGCNLRRYEYVYIKDVNTGKYVKMFNAGDHAIAVDCGKVDFNTWTLTFENLPINREFIARTAIYDCSFYPPKLLGLKDVGFDTNIP